MSDITTVILAAGNSTRFKASKSKLVYPLCGQPIVAHIFNIAKKIPLNLLTKKPNAKEIKKPTVIDINIKNIASLIFKKISNSKKGKILSNNSQIDDLIRNNIKNNDYLMIKASLATGFNKIVNEIKGLN